MGVLLSIVPVFGPPSHILLRGVALVRALAEASIGPCDFIHENDVEGLGRAWRERRAKSCILFSDCPSRQIVEVILSGTTPAILFLDEPQELVRYAMEAMYFSAIDSVRLVSRHLSLFHDLLARKDFVLITRSSGSMYDVMETICTRLGLKVPAAQRHAICGRIAGDDAPHVQFMPSAQDNLLGDDRLNAASRTLIITALESFRPLYMQERMETAVWPPNAFLAMEPLGGFCGGPIDLVGPARMICFGPYMHLPLGSWSATVEIDVGDNESGNVLVVDLFGGVEPGIFRADLPTKGTFEFDLPVVVKDTDQPIEIRFAVGQGSIDGWIDIRRVSFRRN